MSLGEVCSFKVRLCEEWLKGDHILIHCDSRLDEVIVPAHLKGNPMLTLKMSHLFNFETVLTDEHISSQLKFSGEYFACSIPWSSIWGITRDNGQQKVWQDSIPKDILGVLQAIPKDSSAEDKPTSTSEKKAEDKKPSPLRRVK